MSNNITNKSLLILQLNSNGLKNHMNELKTLFYNKCIDIALITETHFTKYSFVHIPGYKLLKTNNPDNTAHGGVAILIKTSIAFHPLTHFCQPFLTDYFSTINNNNS